MFVLLIVVDLNFGHLTEYVFVMRVIHTEDASIVKKPCLGNFGSPTFASGFFFVTLICLFRVPR